MSKREDESKLATYDHISEIWTKSFFPDANERELRELNKESKRMYRMALKRKASRAVKPDKINENTQKIVLYIFVTVVGILCGSLISYGIQGQGFPSLAMSIGTDLLSSILVLVMFDFYFVRLVEKRQREEFHNIYVNTWLAKERAIFVLRTKLMRDLKSLRNDAGQIAWKLEAAVEDSHKIELKDQLSEVQNTIVRINDRIRALPRSYFNDPLLSFIPTDEEIEESEKQMEKAEYAYSLYHHQQDSTEKI